MFSPLARLPELCLEALSPREHALEFGTIKASSWRCSGLLPGVSPVFNRTETILGEMFSPLARLPELCLGALPPREHALEFGTIRASSWRCSGLLPGVSPVFDRTETVLGEIFSPLARLPELSLGTLPPREHALEFGTIKASSWRCSGLLPRSPQYSIVQKLFWGKFFPHSPGSQSCVWEHFPPESTLSSSVPSRYLLGAVAVYYRGLPSVQSYRNCSGGNLFPTRQAPRAVSGSASPPRASSRVRYHRGIFLAL